MVGLKQFLVTNDTEDVFVVFGNMQPFHVFK